MYIFSTYFRSKNSPVNFWHAGNPFLISLLTAGAEVAIGYMWAKPLLLFINLVFLFINCLNLSWHVGSATRAPRAC